LGKFALAECEDFDWHGLAGYDCSAASPMLMIGDFFLLHGRSLPFEPEIITRMLEIDYLMGMDRIPYRAMEMQYAFGRIGLPNDLQQLAASFSETSFGLKQRIERSSIDDIYSLTHSIFYLTDVGTRPMGSLFSADEVERIRNYLYRLIVILIRVDNCDVLGELILCLHFCDFRPRGTEETIYRSGIARMLRSQAPHGSIASTENVRLRDINNEASFTELYHTTLVGALALSTIW
jgi:hypothetical protein